MSSVVCWHVYFVSPCRHAKPSPKDKFVVIVCIDSEPHGFLINSRVNSYITSRPSLLACEVQILASQHRFLSHDSWVDCRDIYSFQTAELVAYRGSIASSARQSILDGVQKCPVLAPYYKKLIRTQAIV